MPTWLLTSKYVLREAVAVLHLHGNTTIFEVKVLNGSVFKLPTILTPIAACEMRITFLKGDIFKEDV